MSAQGAELQFPAQHIEILASLLFYSLVLLQSVFFHSSLNQNDSFRLILLSPVAAKSSFALLVSH